MLTGRYKWILSAFCILDEERVFSEIIWTTLYEYEISTCKNKIKIMKYSLISRWCKVKTSESDYKSTILNPFGSENIYGKFAMLLYSFSGSYWRMRILASWSDIFSSCIYRSNSSVFWVRFCNYNQIWWSILGLSQTWNICSNHGLLFIREATISGFKCCCFYGHCYSWGKLP